MRRNQTTGGFEFHDPLFSECKSYAAIAIRSDPMFETAQQANELVKEYIRARGLIVYGGEAIDGAVRMRGGSLYSEDAVPDYDFYSADSVEDAYTLADILYSAGMSAARAINGIHFGTMRVDAGDNHFMADLSHVPAELFAIIPTITTPDGIRRVHPGYQRCDIHRALSKPYLDPPQEAIFNRLAKDIARYNLLEKYYPASELVEFLNSPGELAGKAVLVPRELLTRPLTGLIASRIYREVCAGPASGPTFSGATDLEKKSLGISILLPAEIVERISVNISPMASSTRQWFADLLLEATISEVAGLAVITANTHGQLIPVSTITYQGLTVRLACVQHVLWWLLSHFWASRAGKLAAGNLEVLSARDLGDIYLREYIDLAELVHRRGDDHPLLASWLENSYGDLNESAGARIQKSRAAGQANKEGQKNNPPVKFPMNYTPGRTSAKNHPPWDSSTFESVPH